MSFLLIFFHFFGCVFSFFFQAEDGIRDADVTGVQTCAFRSALAEHVGGSVAGFVALMNRKAEEIGIHRTHFLDPAGLEDRGYSTAKDVAAVVRAAYMQPLFALVTRTKFHK